MGLDEIDLDDSMENKCELSLLLDTESCFFGLLCIQLVQALYAVCRGFSWEKNYPGDEGISGTYLAADATHQYEATLECKRRVPLLATPHAMVPASDNVFHVGCLVQALGYLMAWVLLLGKST